MWSRDSSAFVPSSVTTRPFTVTRPETIISSARRREARPARAMIFCRRSSMWLAARAPRRLQLSRYLADGEALRRLAVGELPDIIEERSGARIDGQVAGVRRRVS